MRVLVLGYYYQHNLGDDAFPLVMPALFPTHELTFSHGGDLQNLDYDAVLVGGGDLVNDYFYKRFVPLFQRFRTAQPHGRIMAIGLGIPYPQLIDQGYLDHFDHVFLRSQHDLLRVQRRLGSQFAHYLPDLAFGLPPPLPVAVRHSALPCVGVFLIPSAPVDALERLFWKLSKRYQLILYRFNTSGTQEDEQELNVLLQNRLAHLWHRHPRSARKREPILLNNRAFGPMQMLDEMATLDLAICMRFHSHVFSALAGLPFLSIGKTRKVELLVEELAWPYAVSAESSADEMRSAFQSLASQRSLRSKLMRRVERAQLLLDSEQPALLLRECRPHRGQPHALDAECRALAHDYWRQAEPSGPAERNRIAEDMCWRLTRDPHSAYLHGARENMRSCSSTDQLFESIKWIMLDVQRQRTERCFDLDFFAQDSLRGLHRAGWQYCLDYLRSLQSSSGVLLDAYCDRTFHWARERMRRQGLLPYTSPWVGFVHHTPHPYTEYNAAAMLQQREFQQSLPTCYGLICLSRRLAEWLADRVPVAVLVLKHPTADAQPFSMRRFLANPERALVQIGAWYRNPWTLHTLELPDFVARKLALQGKSMEAYFAPPHVYVQRRSGRFAVYGSSSTLRRGCTLDTETYRDNKWLTYLERWLNEQRLELGDLQFALDEPSSSTEAEALRSLLLELCNSVQRIAHLSDQQYDALLRENIVFLDLIDCSACNTLIECIVRNTPIIVNPLPAVVEYLGADYPLYWRGQPLQEWLSEDKVRRAHRYLRKRDKGELRVSHFVDQLRSSELFQRCSR